MNIEKVNNRAPTRGMTDDGASSNVSTFVKKTERTYVRRYAMTEGKRRLWLENHMPEKAYDIMFPCARRLKVEEAVADPARREKAKLLLVCLALALVLLLLYPLVRFAMSRLVIAEALVEGSALYTADELLEASGLAPGDGLPILAARSSAEERLLTSMPYISSCNITVQLPGTVIFDIEEETAAICARILDEYYALSAELRVLERSASREDFAGLLFAELPYTERAVVGERLILSDAESGDYIRSFLALLASSELDGRIDIIYFDKKYDMVASVDNKYRVLFGSPSDMKLKIAAASKIIDENEDKCQGCGIIDLRVVEIAGITLNADIDPEKRE